VTPTQAHNDGQLRTDLQKLSREFRAERRIWTTVDKGKRAPKPQVAHSVSIPAYLHALFGYLTAAHRCRSSLPLIAAAHRYGGQESL
jgi:hypothetical protein